MKPERQFRQSVTRHLKGTVYVWSINDSWQAGVPDHYYSGFGGDLWAEYKYFDRDRHSFCLTNPPKRPKLTRQQQLWLNKRYDEGRNVWVIVGMPGGGVILRHKMWMYPTEGFEMLSRKQIATEILAVVQGTYGRKR